MLGIINGDHAKFTFVLEDGQTEDVEVSAASSEEFDKFYSSNDTQFFYPEDPFLIHSDRSALWYKHFDDDTIYIRARSFYEIDGDQQNLSELKKYLSDVKSARKLVLDLRWNTGGYSDFRKDLFYALREFESPQKYILVDTLTNSESINLVYVLQHYTNGQFQVVGTVCWNTNYAGNSDPFEVDLPILGKLKYYIPSVLMYLSEDGELLQPDVKLYWEYEDYANGRDTYLEWVKNQ